MIWYIAIYYVCLNIVYRIIVLKKRDNIKISESLLKIVSHLVIAYYY